MYLNILKKSINIIIAELDCIYNLVFRILYKHDIFRGDINRF